MKHALHCDLSHSLADRGWRDVEHGQALLEFIIVVALMVAVVMLMVDFGRALNYQQVMIGLSRQGSNLASRGNTLAESADAVLIGSMPLDLAHQGSVIVTSVTNLNNVNRISGQVWRGGLSSASKVGSGVGSTATVPAGAASMIQPGQTIYITEVFYAYRPITPVGRMLRFAMPATLYEAAYF